MSPRSTSLGRSTLSTQVTEAVLHPIHMLWRLRGRLELAREGGDVEYAPTEEFDERFHELLGAAWPCQETPRFRELWEDLTGTMTNLGVGHDADPAFAQTLWCTTKHSAPRTAVEIGVGRGISSRSILEAMASSEGRLFSIDLPPLLEGWRTSVAEAVPTQLRDRWTYLRGPGRRQLPKLLRRVAGVDMFVHDGLHTAPTVMRELGLVWPHLRQGGVMLVDGIHRSEAFRTFAAAQTSQVLIGAHEHKRGYLGLIRKD